tara:strand:+ start:1468 stop:2520 length:1053 start_codon:yes stop_codon:yes gene_type:complete
MSRSRDLADSKPSLVSDQANTSTGYLDIATGTTAQRPGSPSSGNLRFNTTTSKLEFYNGSAWVSLKKDSSPYSATGHTIINSVGRSYDLIVFTAGDGTSSYKFTPLETITIDLLIVAAGGGTSAYRGGGGGGQVITHTGISISSGADYYITVGTGNANGVGGNSFFKHSDGSTIEYQAVGGGKSDSSGLDGGSGGGEISSDTNYGAGSSTKITSHTSFSGGTINNYGNAGGNNYQGASPYGTGGGGGASQVGGDSTSTRAGNGGTGIDVSSTFGTDYGESGFFGGGGGGMLRTTTGEGKGGFGGGGRGGTSMGNDAEVGTANTGGGAGGQGTSGSNLAGGSGIVIIRVAV